MKIEERNEAMHVAKMMIRYGGGFVSHLGIALTYADMNNTLRIKEAFPEYWEQYNNMPKSEVD